MPEKERVIKGLEYHLKELSVGKTCFECPYWGDNPCEIHLIADALTLLKEQKALPIVYQNNEYTGLPMALCPSCGEPLDSSMRVMGKNQSSVITADRGCNGNE